MAEARRGRKTHEAYHELVAKALGASRFALDGFPVLSQLPAVERWVADHPREMLPRGKALQGLLRQAVVEVIASVGEADDRAMCRLVEYLQLRYQQRLTVKAIAERWGCSTVQVWRGTGHRALDLVTMRFLELARGPSTARPPSPSGGRFQVVEKVG
jgi:hypothetical protein